MEINAVIKLYERHTRNINLADSSIKNYIRELKYFSDFLVDLGVKNIEDVKVLHIDMYIAQLIDKGNRANTRKRKRSILNTFFQYCLNMEIISKNPAAVISTIKVTDDDKKKKYVLTDKEIEKIHKNIQKKSRNVVKTRCLMTVFLLCAIRTSELCGLKWDDINFKDKIIEIRGKGRKNRKVPLFVEIEKDLKQIKKEQQPKSEYVFTSKNTGNPMKPRAVHDIVKKYATSAVKDKVIGPHRLRATAATDYSRMGVSLKYLQLLMGHENSATTLIYVNPDEKEMSNVFQELVKQKKKGKNK